MKDSREKRNNPRCVCKVPVTCAFFNSDRFYRGKAMNHCDNGIYFESNFPAKPGATIYIRVENNSIGSSSPGTCRCKGLRSIGVAEVKWCKELTDAADSYYGIGLKYYQPPV